MTAIYSDDVEAVEKLRAKLGKLKTQQDRMKAVNKGWRKAGKPKADNVEAWQGIADGMGCTLEDLGPTRVDMARDFMDRAPYSYHITNNGGNMKRIKDRIVKLVRIREAHRAEIIEEAEAESKEAFDKLTPQGQVAAKGLVDAFFKGEDELRTVEFPLGEIKEATDDLVEEQGEWFPPPNRG
jgi:hypothetical protein